MSLLSDLAKIQEELKVPKVQYNSFSKYHYRSCEDIVEAVKPILLKYNVTMILTDDIVQIGQRFYIKATCKLMQNDEMVETSAFAREAEIKKGMDEAQITGAASSYARKYALNGMFSIDDTKDADTKDNSTSTKEKINYQKVSVATLNKLKNLIEMINVSDESIKKWCISEHVNNIEQFSDEQAQKYIRACEKKLKEQETNIQSQDEEASKIFGEIINK